MITKSFYLSFVALITIGLCGCSSTATSRSAGQFLDDKAIAANVKTRMLLDSSLESGSSIKVISFLDHILLSGFANSERQKELASEIARNVKGVGWVKNDIIVKDSLPGFRAGTPQISEAAGSQNPPAQNELLASNQKTPGTNIVSGSIPARKTAVRSRETLANPAMSTEDIVKAETGNEITALNNYLARQLRSEFKGDPTMSSAVKNLHVGVENGKVVITGVAGSVAEKAAITDRVRDLMFENKITIK
ncbi:MAG: transporter [Verrucomicrobiales bacterium]|nr:transporter [Verrucomicrobiales bacterium]